MIFDLSSKFGAQKAREKLKEYFDKGYTVKIERIRQKRTLRQNSYLHVVIQLYAIHLGYTLDEAKLFLKRNCDFMRYEKGGEEFYRRTRDLDTKECTMFIEWIRNRSSQEGYYIPSANESLQSWDEIQEYIKGYSEYL